MKNFSSYYDRASLLLTEWGFYKTVHYDQKFSAAESIDLYITKSTLESYANLLRRDLLVGHDQYIREDVESFSTLLWEFKNRYLIDMLAKP